MVKIIKKVVLFLLYLQKTIEWTLFRYPLVQKMWNQDPSVLQNDKTAKARLQVHCSKKQRNKDIPSMETDCNDKELKMLNM